MAENYRTIPVEEMIARLSEERQQKIEVRAAELIAEEIAARALDHSIAQEKKRTAKKAARI